MTAKHEVETRALIKTDTSSTVWITQKVVQWIPNCGSSKAKAQAVNGSRHLSLQAVSAVLFWISFLMPPR